MNPVKITDTHPILLSAESGPEGLEIRYEAEPVVARGLEITLDEVRRVQLRLADVYLQNTLHQVYAWTIADDGTLEPWARVGATSESPTVAARDLTVDPPTTADFVALAVPDGEAAPTPTSADQATQQGASRVRVKIRKGGVRPIPSLPRRPLD